MADDLQKPTSLYDRDIVAWSEQQAVALRARKGADNALDYDNLAEEIEDVGRSEYRACESQIENIIEHLLKIEFVGPAQTTPHWRKEVFGFRRELAKRRTATIDNRLMPEIDEAFAYVVKSMVSGGLLPDADTVFAVRPGYEWDQIVDSDWFPDARYDIDG